jgi:tetratricopeptide (TPR) repeat protein
MKARHHKKQRSTKASRSFTPSLLDGKIEDMSARQLHSVLLDAEQNRRTGNLDIAEKICRKILNVHPKYIGFLQTFGLIALEKKHYPQAVNCFLTAAAEAPDDWTNYSNLAAAWLGLGIPQMASLALQEARKLNPHDAEVHFMMGEVFSDDREYELAMQAYRDALALNPKHSTALFKLCDCLINLGYFSEAKKLLIRLQKLRPDSVAVVHLMSQFPVNAFQTDLSKALDATSLLPTETKEEFENNQLFVRANLLHRAGRYEDSWRALQAANDYMHQHQNVELKKSAARRARDLDFASSFPKLKAPSGHSVSASRRPVALFIAGPSRAGKTTLETLVGCHSGVKRGYENHKVEFAVKRASQKAGLVTLRSLPLLPEPLHQSFAETFREIIAASAEGAAVFTNTNPGLIGSTAKLAMALPEARFIFVTRDKMDLALRVFMKKYKSGNHYSYNLEAIQNYLVWYEKMVDLLHEKLPGRSIKLRYEDIVGNPSRAVEASLSLCGVEADALELPQVSSDVGVAEPYVQWMKGHETDH